MAGIIWNATILNRLVLVKPLDVSYWTLGVETTFYTLVLLSLMTKQLARIEFWGTVLMILLVLFHVGLSQVWYQAHNGLTHRIEFVNHAPLFFIGILFYGIQHQGLTWQRVLLIGLCFVFQIALHGKGYTFYTISIVQHAAMLSVYLVAFSLFIAGRMGWVVNPVTSLLGKISYSLYLLQNLLGSQVLIPHLESLGINYLPSRLLTIVMMIGLAVLFNRYIENPSNLYVRNWYKARQRPVLA